MNRPSAARSALATISRGRLILSPQVVRNDGMEDDGANHLGQLVGSGGLGFEDRRGGIDDRRVGIVADEAVDQLGRDVARGTGVGGDQIEHDVAVGKRRLGGRR